MEQRALSHFGTVGMRWGVRRAEKAGGTYSSRRTKAIGKHVTKIQKKATQLDTESAKQLSKGNIDKANKLKSKADIKREDAAIVANRQKRSQTVDDIRKNAVKTTTRGQDLAYAILLGGNASTEKSLSKLKDMNGKSTRTSGEKRAQDWVDMLLLGNHAAESREASKYIYK